MGQAKKKQEKKDEPLLQSVAKGYSKELFATNEAYLNKYNKDLAIAVKEQSSYSEVFVVNYANKDNFKIQMYVSNLMNGLLMHSKISESLEDYQVLEKAMKILPCKGVFLFEATEMYVEKFTKVKIGTPLVNNVKSGYVPSVLLKTNIFSKADEKGNRDYVSMDTDTAYALQVLDPHSNEMIKEFGIEFGKMLKPLFKHCGMNLVAGEYSIGIDSTNNMRLVDFHLYLKDGTTGKVLPYSEVVSKLGL